MEVRVLAGESWDDGDAILRDAYVGGGYVDALRADALTMKEYSGAGTWLGALDGVGALVGLLLLTSFGSSAAVVAERGGAEVRLLAVAPAARRSGAGRALMAESERLARLRGLQAMTFSTQRTMVAAHGLYRSLGYKRAESLDYAVGARDFIVFHKRLVEAAV